MNKTEDNQCIQPETVRTQVDVDNGKLLSLMKSSLLCEQSVDSLGNSLQTETLNEHIAATEKNLLEAVSILTTINSANKIPKEVILYTILLSGEHSENEYWSSSEIQCSIRKLMKIILEHSSCHNLTDILVYYKVNYFLTDLKPKLLPSTWKKYPAAVVCFVWIVHLIKFPHMEDNLNSILPVCLLLVDDHVNRNKIKGLKCLHQLVKSVSRTDLIQYGRGDVIYSAVEHMIYLRDSEIIIALAKLLVEFLSKTEHSFSTNTLLWTHFDDVLNIWLPSMEMEQNMVLREAYIDSLNSLLQAMGLAGARWSFKLLSVISEYSEQDHTLDQSLLCLLTFINTTWPKISPTIHLICLILFKVIIRLYNKTASSKPSKRTHDLLKVCFDSVYKISSREYNKLILEIKENNELNKYCKSIFQE